MNDQGEAVLELFICREGRVKPVRWQVLFGHRARGGLVASDEFPRKRDAERELRRLKRLLLRSVAADDFLGAARRLLTAALATEGPVPRWEAWA